MSWFFKEKVKKEDIEQIKTAVQTGFNNIKNDFNKTSQWIKHLDEADSSIKEEIMSLKTDLSSIRDELENLQNVIDLMNNNTNSKQVFKQTPTVFNKQTSVYSVSDSVQTSVQTPFLDNLTATERAIIFILLNSDMKLSYEDISAMMGKSKATIRGQINAIKQKSEGLIEEQISENSKKRVFIPEKTREILLKTRKVRVKKSKNNQKNEENQ